MSAVCVHWGPSGFFLAAGVHIFAVSSKARSRLYARHSPQLQVIGVTSKRKRRKKNSTRSRGWHISSQLLCGSTRRGSNLRVFPFPHHRYTCQFFRSNACFREKTESGRAVTHDWLNHPKRKRVSGWPYAISSVRCNLMFETEGNEEDSEDGRGPACSMPDSFLYFLHTFLTPGCVHTNA